MANDHFEEYYAEKLWETIPSIYRHEDGLATEPGVLRAMVQVIARQAAILRRSQDSLWDDQFIELCNEWAVPYIGDLVATRMLSDLNKRGRRIDVAKTIYYRRRKGTPRILEELISDISDWEGKMVEQFQKLARSRHGLDPKPQPLAGKFSGTLPGGWADLRNQRASELTNGPFEEFFHTPDVRRQRGINGRYAISKLAFYLYRLEAFEAVNITPFSIGDGIRFSFDPSGRDIPLFSKSSPSTDWNEWKLSTEPEISAPIPCRLLGHATYLLSESNIQQLIAPPTSLSIPAADELRKISGLIFKNERSLMNIIETFVNGGEIKSTSILLPLLSFSLMNDCGKCILLPDATTVLDSPLKGNSIMVGFASPTQTIFTNEKVAAAKLESWPAAINKELAVDPEKGRLMFLNPLATDEEIYIAYYYGFSGHIGAGSYERKRAFDQIPNTSKSGGGEIFFFDLHKSGITLISDSKTYGPVASKLSIINLTLQSANKQRPFILLQSNWVLNSGSNKNSELTLVGLWIGAEGNQELEIILRGDYECVVIRNCTLDPGGSTNIRNEILHPVRLIIDGKVEHLCIESSIMGPVLIRNNGYVEELAVSDSIIQSVDDTVNAIEIKTGRTHINRSTVFGKVAIHRMEASEALFTDLVDVSDTQNGCFRFSAAKATSRLPHPYESFLFDIDTNHWFTSRRFGDPGYAQLSDTAPKALVRGAENGSEIGAFCNLLNPIKLDGLKAKLDEYMTFGLIPIFINKT